MKEFDELIKKGEYGEAGYLLADEYYKNGKMGYTRKKLIEILANEWELQKVRVSQGFYLTKQEYVRLVGNKLNINDKCYYCKGIDEATKKSPRKKYMFCPMCGRKIHETKQRTI